MVSLGENLHVPIILSYQSTNYVSHLIKNVILNLDGDQSQRQDYRIGTSSHLDQQISKEIFTACSSNTRQTISKKSYG